MSDGLDKVIGTVEGTKTTKKQEAFLSELFSRSEAVLYEEGKQILEARLDIKFEPDPTADDTCYLRIYKKAKPFSNKGIEFPPDFFYYRSVSPQEFKDLSKIWRSEIKDLELDTAQFWFPVVAAQSKNNFAPIESFVSKLLKLKAQYDGQHGDLEGYEQSISINPDKPQKNLPQCFIPPRSWLDLRLSELKPEHILTLLPKPERKLFMLFLGRILCGRDSSIPLDKDVEILRHRYRKMCVLYGSEPGTGKSAMCQGIISSLQMIGYVVSTFRSFEERFNMGEIYRSNLAFKDDNTSDGVKKILGSEDIKSVITGSILKAENKGKDAFDITASCAVMFITNDFDQNHLFGRDAGVVDRLSVLYTLTNAELQTMQDRSEDPLIRQSPDLRTPSHIPWLAKKYNVDPSSIWFHLFRLSADYFLEYTESGQLEKEIALQTSYLRFPLTHSALQNVISAMHLGALCCSKKEDYKESALYPLINKASLLWIAKKYVFLLADPRAHCARNALKADWVEKGRPATHPWIGIKLVSSASAKRMLEVLHQDFNNPAVSLEELIKKSFGELSTVEGISIGSGRIYVKKAWSTCINPSGSRSLLAIADKVHNIMKNPRLRKAYSDMLRDIPPDIEYVESPGYRADFVANYLDEFFNNSEEEPLDFVQALKRKG